MHNLKKLIMLLSKPVAYTIELIMVIILVLIPDIDTKSPIGPHAFQQHANNNPLIDTIINYSPQYAYTLIDGYGSKGRAYYICQCLSLDLVIPLLMFLFISSSVYIIYRGTGIRTYVDRLVIIPLLGMVFDYLENISVLLMIFNYPKQITYIPVIANVFSLLKGFFDSLGLLIVVAGLIIILIKLVIHKKRGVS